MYDVEYFDRFVLLTRAMIFVREAAKAGGTVDLYSCPTGGFIDEAVEGNMFADDFLPTFGTIQEDPDPKRGDYATYEEYDEAVRNHKCLFTLNENGWKLAEHIKHLWDDMADVVPSQQQVDAWTNQRLEEFENR